MNYYEIMLEALQEKVDNGELTLEDAERLNGLAFEKYVGVFEESEKSDDEELVESLLEAVKNGTKLSKDVKEEIKKMLEESDEDDSEEEDDEKESDDKEDESDSEE